MDDLVTWLRGVLDEDEHDWWSVANQVEVQPMLHGRYLPKAALADVEAKRAVLDEHSPIWRDVSFNASDEDGTYDTEEEIEVCVICVPRHSWFPTRESVPAYPCRTVRLLASAYRDRPGYRDEWRP